MDALWLLQGPYEAPGWKALEADSRGNKVDLLLFDRSAWALLRAPAAPTQYDGLAAGTPPDGLYLDDQGRGVYVVAGRQVRSANDVVAALGAPAQELLAKLRDADTVLERLGRVY